MRLRHTDGSECPKCEEIIKTAHPYMADWFRRKKKENRSLHCSCAWRGAAEQNRAFAEKKSKLMFPFSKHNKTKNGEPCSEALDLFQIDADGNARFSMPFYQKIANENEADKEPIRWLGDSTLKDGPHFELIEQADSSEVERS